MSWDPVWEEVFSSREWGRYPNEELVRFVARNFYGVEDRSAVRILELGCGAGANLWYLAREGFDAYGIDGSATAVETARARLAAEGLDVDVRVGDVARLAEAGLEPGFDAVIDVGCLQCNRVAAVEAAIASAHELLRPGGRIWALLVTRGSWGDGTGEEIEPGTYAGTTEGPLAGFGLQHFFSLEEVERLFAEFADLSVEHVERSYDDRRHVYRTWVVSAIKS